MSTTKEIRDGGMGKKMEGDQARSLNEDQTHQGVRGRKGVSITLLTSGQSMMAESLRRL